jgi:hypothetical protein
VGLVSVVVHYDSRACDGGGAPYASAVGGGGGGAGRTPAGGAAQFELAAERALEGVEGLHVMVLLGRSSLLVMVLVLYTGVLFCYTLLVRSLVYVLGEELLLLWWLRCCCSCWP